MSAFNDDLKRAFSFLLQRGYELIVESGDGAFGGAVTYRSTQLWIAIEWDRGDVRLEFAPTNSWLGRVPWDNIDHLLRNVPRFEGEPPPLLRTAPVDELVAFAQTHLTEIERRFAPPERATTEAFLKELQRDRARRADEYWHRGERRQ